MVHVKIKIAVTVRRGISKRSHEKIGDCEQSIDMHARAPEAWKGYNYILTTLEHN